LQDGALAARVLEKRSTPAQGAMIATSQRVGGNLATPRLTVLEVASAGRRDLSPPHYICGDERLATTIWSTPSAASPTRPSRRRDCCSPAI